MSSRILNCVAAPRVENTLLHHAQHPPQSLLTERPVHPECQFSPRAAVHDRKYTRMTLASCPGCRKIRLQSTQRVGDGPSGMKTIFVVTAVAVALGWMNPQDAAGAELFGADQGKLPL